MAEHCAACGRPIELNEGGAWEHLDGNDNRHRATPNNHLESLRLAVGQLRKERDEARANYRWMVEHAADAKLDGYRELAARVADAENAVDRYRELAARTVAAESALEIGRIVAADERASMGRLRDAAERRAEAAERRAEAAEAEVERLRTLEQTVRSALREHGALAHEMWRDDQLVVMDEMAVRIVRRPSPHARSHEDSEGDPIAPNRIDKPLWSILVMTIPGREDKLARLLSSLEQQADRAGDVEVLVLRDNRAMSIADKRNALIGAARGEYASFVDDDDYVAPDYVASIREALVATGGNAGVVCFRVWTRVQVDGVPPISGVTEYAFEPEGAVRAVATLDGGHERIANHLMVWRTVLARLVSFREGPEEDTRWAEDMRAVLAGRMPSVVVGTDILYTYDADYRGRYAKSGSSGT